LSTALLRHRCIIDASPATDIIDERHINQDTYISAPGMPSGLSPEALSKISDRFLHDPLQIGVATMIVEAVKE
jgi:pyrrolysine biosynthesis protein PylD